MASTADAVPVLLARPGAELVPLTAAAPLSLDRRAGLLLIESGNVDLFGVAESAGEPGGRRHPLCRFSAGQVILGLPPGGRLCGDRGCPSRHRHPRAERG
jgi:hypothetical protein